MENFKEELNEIRSLFNELKDQDSNKLHVLGKNPSNEISGKDEFKKPENNFNLRDFEDFEQ
jgi:hypothetical protein